MHLANKLTEFIDIFILIYVGEESNYLATLPTQWLCNLQCLW
jgi:hypothetical protein